jgi:hypothetical protein
MTQPSSKYVVILRVPWPSSACSARTDSTALQTAAVLLAISHRAHQCCACKQVWRASAPLRRYTLDRIPVRSEQASPERRILSSKRLLHGDVQWVITQDQLGIPKVGGIKADHDVAGVWVAVNLTPAEHLCAEEFDHGLHDRLKAGPTRNDHTTLHNCGQWASRINASSVL